MLLKKLLPGAMMGMILLAGSLATLPLLPAKAPDNPPPKAKPPAAAPAAPELPAWKKEFNKVYGLADGEILKRVAPPFPECRMDHYRIDMDWQHKHIPHPPTSFAFTSGTFRAAANHPACHPRNEPHRLLAADTRCPSSSHRCAPPK
jgi:hypothetical protein